MKRVLGVYESGSKHWVGDGFPVRNVFPSNGLNAEMNPFLLLDYAGPASFEPTDQSRGVGEHPHRGFETVTIVYQGAVEHRDSAGNSGTLHPGDVQWMTAASGVVHEEKHAREFSNTGGTFELIQLWVNLPKAHKMSVPRYQGLLNAQIPAAELPEGGGRVRVIAGQWNGLRGPAKTFTPVTLLDARLSAGAKADFDLPEGHTAAILLLEGAVTVNSSEPVRGEAKLVLLDRTGAGVSIHAAEESTLLILSGEPIPEPVASWGPFVMNTKEELVQAVEDYKTGRMGHLH